MHVGDEIRNEHDEARRVIGKMEKGDVALRKNLFPALDKTLRAHFKAEEVVVVPQMVKVPELKKLGQEITEDHRAVRMLLDDLKGLSYEDAVWLARWSSINSLLTAHFWKEENVVIPHAPEYFPMNALEQLATKFQEVFKSEMK